MKIFVLFGSTGDLARRYVLPALEALLARGAYDHLVCVGRRDWKDEDFYNFLSPYPYFSNQKNSASYLQIDITRDNYSTLKSHIASFGRDVEVTYHLCLSPEFFVPVATGLASVGLNTSDARIMIEKPF